jgi:hypothetical protein
MTHSADLNAIAARRVVYRASGMDDVSVRRDLTYVAADGSAQAIDVYYPPSYAAGQRTPAVLIVSGFADAGMRRFLGRPSKDLGSNVSWAQLIAASGIAAITYVNVDAASDANAVLNHVRTKAASIGIDANRVGIWACSGNVPNALSVLMDPRHEKLKCAALLYGYMLDLDGATAVADMSKKWGYVNPAAGKSMGDLPSDLAIFIARAGRDETPHLNESLDSFVSHALARNVPVAVVNHHRGPHSFDAAEDGDASREVVKQILAFFRFHLIGHTQE